MKPDLRNIDQFVNRHLPIASPDEAKAVGVRVWHRLQAKADRASGIEARLDEAQPAAARDWRRFSLASAAALVLAAAIATAIVWRPADDALYRVVEGNVHQGETIRSNGGGGAVLALADGTRVEMRSESELALERADDGLRIRLHGGGIIVDAAGQRTGHLYVQTKDVTVSVVGTVFLVNAGDEGSRVAVIEGEVRVQQGTTEKTLLPGEQVATNPSMDVRPFRDVISWSRNASALIALLWQSAAVPPALAPQNAAQPREAFELASIRPTRFTANSGRGGAGTAGQSSLRPVDSPCGDHPNSFFLRFDPSRALISDMTLYGLIAWAYSIDCRTFQGSELLVGGPGWVKQDGWDIEALFPPGTSAYISEPFPAPRGRTGYSQIMTPQFRRMLQTLLAERFNLVLRREPRQVTAFDLVVAKTGPKLTPSKEGDWRMAYLGVGLYDGIENGINDRPEYKGLIVGAMSARRQTMAAFATRLAAMTSRPVFDRTGIEGEFTYEFFFAPDQWRNFVRDPNDTRPTITSPSLFAVLEEELGLRLEPSREPVDVLVIERVERPSEN
jgi:uncharacterized protein (TIGR03435 family)